MASTFRRALARGLSISVVVAGTTAVAVVGAQQQSTPPPATPPAAGQQTSTPPPATPPAAGQTVVTAVTAGQGANANTPAPPAPPPVPVPADRKALTDANAIKDPAAKLAALRKFQDDFPESSQLTSANTTMLDVLVMNFPDQQQEIVTALDHVVGDIPAAVSADQRLASVQNAVNKMIEKKLLLDKVGQVLADTMLECQMSFESTRAKGIELQARVHLAKGDAALAERELKAAMAANATLTIAPMELARIEANRGNARAALDYYVTASLNNATFKPADHDAFRAAFRTTGGTDAGFDAMLDKAYKDKFPNPVKTTPYAKPAERTDRLVIGEMFTGSGCPPCVSADLALEAALDRYPADAFVALAYHANIPQPDPMVVAGSDVRRTYYKVNGVPTFEIDGVTVGQGGGARENAPRNYGDYRTFIDKELTTAPKAAVKLKATSDGKTIKVTATVSNVADGTKDGRLHLVLAEKDLRFVGENNIRFHEMVVRDVAGEKNAGFALNATGETTVEYTFDIAKIKDDVTKTIAAEIVKRRKAEDTAGRAPADYRAENHAMVDIDPSALVVVAFVQDANKAILQAARIDVSAKK